MFNKWLAISHSITIQSYLAGVYNTLLAYMSQFKLVTLTKIWTGLDWTELDWILIFSIFFTFIFHFLRHYSKSYSQLHLWCFPSQLCYWCTYKMGRAQILIIWHHVTLYKKQRVTYSGTGAYHNQLHIKEHWWIKC